MHSGQRVFEIAVTAVTLITQPLCLFTPVYVDLRFPLVGAATGETEGFEAHAFQRHIADKNKQIGPRNAVAVLLLDGPQQAAPLVQVAVIRPAVQRRKTLHARASTTTAITGTVRACRVPRQTNEERAIVTIVRWPPRLTVRHQRLQIILQRFQIERLERFCIVKVAAHWVRLLRLLAENFQIQIFWPPVVVATDASAGVHYRALAGTLLHASIHHGNFLQVSVLSIDRPSDPCG